MTLLARGAAQLDPGKDKNPGRSRHFACATAMDDPPLSEGDANPIVGALTRVPPQSGRMSNSHTTGLAPDLAFQLKLLHAPQQPGEMQSTQFDHLRSLTNGVSTLDQRSQPCSMRK